MKKLKHKRRRLGAAIVELSICLPIIVLLVYGTIELNSSIFMKQTLTSAAHEGALVGMKQNATVEEVEGRIELILNARGVENYTVEVDTNGIGFDQLESGDPFTIKIWTNPTNKFVDISHVRIQVSSQRP